MKSWMRTSWMKIRPTWRMRMTMTWWETPYRDSSAPWTAPERPTCPTPAPYTLYRPRRKTTATSAIYAPIRQVPASTSRPTSTPTSTSSAPTATLPPALKVNCGRTSGRPTATSRPTTRTRRASAFRASTPRARSRRTSASSASSWPSPNSISGSTRAPTSKPRNSSPGNSPAFNHSSITPSPPLPPPNPSINPIKRPQTITIHFSTIIGLPFFFFQNGKKIQKKICIKLIDCSLDGSSRIGLSQSIRICLLDDSSEIGLS